ncbi:MAG: hypothetical protein ACRDL5_03600 [Solirubrobacteraceae bacterium]
MVPVCATRTVFHYFLHGEPDPARLAAEGLQARLVAGEELAVQREIYDELFAAQLRRPFTSSGVFFMPIDFAALPDSMLAQRPRVAIDIDRLEASASVLTWQLDGGRVPLPATAAALARAAAIWTPELVSSWFGQNRQRLFWRVPQIGCFQARPIAVDGPQLPGLRSAR